MAVPHPWHPGAGSAVRCSLSPAPPASCRALGSILCLPRPAACLSLGFPFGQANPCPALVGGQWGPPPAPGPAMQGQCIHLKRGVSQGSGIRGLSTCPLVECKPVTFQSRKVKTTLYDCQELISCILCLNGIPLPPEQTQGEQQVFRGRDSVPGGAAGSSLSGVFSFWA